MTNPQISVLKNNQWNKLVFSWYQLEIHGGQNRTICQITAADCTIWTKNPNIMQMYYKSWLNRDSLLRECDTENQQFANGDDNRTTSVLRGRHGKK